MDSRLFEYYLANGNSPVLGFEAEALSAFEELVPEDWLPSNPYLSGYSIPIELGLAWCLLRDVAGAKKLLLRAAEQTTIRGHPEFSLRAEIHAAAFLRHLGIELEFLLPSKQKKQKTPDIKAVWGGAPIDIEVRAASQKHNHTLFQSSLYDLAEQIEFRSDADITIYLNGSLEAAGVRDIGSASCTVAPGGFAEAADWWRVVAAHPGNPGVPEPMPPTWWGRPNFNSVRLLTTDKGAQRVTVRSMVPVESYFGPVRDKADNPQRTGDYTYIIALEVSRFPDVEQRLIHEIEKAAPAWDHVSAVLLFFPFFSTHKLTWRAALWRNPYAVRPTPEGFLSQLGEKIRLFPVTAWPT